MTTMQISALSPTEIETVCRAFEAAEETWRRFGCTTALLYSLLQQLKISVPPEEEFQAILNKVGYTSNEHLQYQTFLQIVDLLKRDFRLPDEVDEEEADFSEAFNALGGEGGKGLVSIDAIRNQANAASIDIDLQPFLVNYHPPPPPTASTVGPADPTNNNANASTRRDSSLNASQTFAPEPPDITISYQQFRDFFKHRNPAAVQAYISLGGREDLSGSIPIGIFRERCGVFQWDDALLEQFLEETDTDGDGGIDFDEFQQMAEKLGLNSHEGTLTEHPDGGFQSSAEPNANSKPSEYPSLQKFVQDNSGQDGLTRSVRLSFRFGADTGATTIVGMQNTLTKILARHYRKLALELKRIPEDKFISKADRVRLLNELQQLEELLHEEQVIEEEKHVKKPGGKRSSKWVSLFAVSALQKTFIERASALYPANVSERRASRKSIADASGLGADDIIRSRRASSIGSRVSFVPPVGTTSPTQWFFGNELGASGGATGQRQRGPEGSSQDPPVGDATGMGSFRNSPPTRPYLGTATSSGSTTILQSESVVSTRRESVVQLVIPNVDRKLSLKPSIKSESSVATLTSPTILIDTQHVEGELEQSPSIALDPTPLSSAAQKEPEKKANQIEELTSSKDLKSDDDKTGAKKKNDTKAPRPPFVGAGSKTQSPRAPEAVTPRSKKYAHVKPRIDSVWKPKSSLDASALVGSGSLGSQEIAATSPSKEDAKTSKEDTTTITPTAAKTDVAQVGSQHAESNVFITQQPDDGENPDKKAKSSELIEAPSHASAKVEKSPKKKLGANTTLSDMLLPAIPLHRKPKTGVAPRPAHHVSMPSVAGAKGENTNSVSHVQLNELVDPSAAPTRPSYTSQTAARMLLNYLETPYGNIETTERISSMQYVVERCRWLHENNQYLPRIGDLQQSSQASAADLGKPMEGSRNRTYSLDSADGPNRPRGRKQPRPPAQFTASEDHLNHRRRHRRRQDHPQSGKKAYSKSHDDIRENENDSEDSDYAHCNNRLKPRQKQQPQQEPQSVSNGVGITTEAVAK